MSDKTYNGWTNYETWNVNLWIDNEEGSNRYWSERADEALSDNTEEKTIYRITHEKYEQASAFDSLAEAQETIRGCGDAFETTTLEENGDEILDESGEIVGEVKTVKEFDTETAISSLASSLSDEFSENTPTFSGCYADLLNAALGEVNWYEIASAMIDNAKERATD